MLNKLKCSATNSSYEERFNVFNLHFNQPSEGEAK